MAMEVNSAYASYASSYANKATSQTKVADGTKSASGLTQSANSAEQTTKDYLNNLRQKYSDVNITVVDFKSEKQELSYMLGSSGGKNIAISSNIIEKMAKDPTVAAKYEKVIDEVPKFGDKAKAECEARGSKYIASGVKIDKDGKVTYWGVSQKTGEGPGIKEKMQEQLKEKRAERKKQEKVEAAKKEKLEALEEKQVEKRVEEKERMEFVLAKGDSLDEVIESIADGKAEVIMSDDLKGIEAGSHINLSV